MNLLFVENLPILQQKTTFATIGSLSSAKKINI